MTAEQWRRHLTFAVYRAANGNCQRLTELALMLHDAGTARESLICAGFGDDGDGLLDLIAMVVEAKDERKGEDVTSKQ